MIPSILTKVDCLIQQDIVSARHLVLNGNFFQYHVLFSELFSVFQLPLESGLNFLLPHPGSFFLWTERVFPLHFFHHRRFPHQKYWISCSVEETQCLYLRGQLLLVIDVVVGEHEVADGQSEERDGDGDAEEEGPGDLLVVHPGDHHLRVQAGVVAGEVESLPGEGVGEL